MTLTHGATAEGTLQFSKSHLGHLHTDKVRSLKGLSVSGLGVGTYLGNYDDETDRLYEESITRAMELGCNFFDTAINYRCQRSERVLGRVIKSLVEGKKLKRSQVVVATKGGFIPFDGSPPSNMPTFIRKTYIDTGIVTEDDVVSSCHCMHPAFLQTQIDQSLKNLSLETIDIYYLHNPETQLPAVGAELFFRRLEGAFELLEENVKRGKIQYYGLATWTAFREPEGVVESIPLHKVVDLAKKVGGDHHFCAIQLPYNLAMLEAVSVHSQSFEGKNYPIIPAAASQGLSVMTSAPLLQNQLLDLPKALMDRMPGDLSMPQKALQFVASTPSVTSAMVGMKQKGHVEENLKVLGSPDWDLPTLQRICEQLTKTR